MAKKGDWVRIHRVVLAAAERTAKIPEDTKACDLEMWTKGFLLNETAEIGDEVEKSYINQIELCGKYTKNFVVHLNGSKECTVSKIGLERIKRILKACEKHNLNFCDENLYSDKEIPYIFENISHPLLKICYDSGHRNFLTPNFDICERYGKYITVLHLHENNGLQDEHKKLSVGSPVFNKLKKEINMMNDDVVLASEARGVCENWKEYINSDLKTLKELGKYKKSEMILEN